MRFSGGKRFAFSRDSEQGRFHAWAAEDMGGRLLSLTKQLRYTTERSPDRLDKKDE